MEIKLTEDTLIRDILSKKELEQARRSLGDFIKIPPRSTMHAIFRKHVTTHFQHFDEMTVSDLVYVESVLTNQIKNKIKKFKKKKDQVGRMK